MIGGERDVVQVVHVVSGSQVHGSDVPGGEGADVEVASVYDPVEGDPRGGYRSRRRRTATCDQGP